MKILRSAAALLLLLLAGCQTSQVVMNQPLPRDASGAPAYSPGYSLAGLLRGDRSDIFLALAFSGGGKRSASFAHGVLRGLREMRVEENGRTETLLKQVDYIAAVSGGSFPAMHYGLFRDESFRTFPEEFLKRDINAFIWGIYLLPWNWEWLVNPYFGTNDAMASVYDRLMFHGATYADLERKGLPLISVNATDIAGGIAFPFTQRSFDLLCSSLAPFPVSRAVAASNGFPILFSPITLKSYRQGCLDHPPPEWPLPGSYQPAGLSRRAMVIENMERQMDPSRTRFLHLLDGGIADNLALRSMSNALIVLGRDSVAMRYLAHRTRRIIVISVDGQAATNPRLGQQRVVSGIGQIFSAVSGAQIDAYGFETMLLASQQVDALAERIRGVRCEEAPVLDGHPCGDVRGGLVQISLSGIADPELRARLQAIPTGLTIPDADVDALVSAGEELVQTNTELRSLLGGIGGQAVAADGAPQVQ